MEKLTAQKKQRENKFLHFEGDTDVEEYFEAEEEENASDSEEFSEPDYFVDKKPVRQGPTSRSHYEPEDEVHVDFVPSNDEESSPDELGDSDDDGASNTGKKSKLKKDEEEDMV